MSIKVKTSLQLGNEEMIRKYPEEFLFKISLDMIFAIVQKNIKIHECVTFSVLRNSLSYNDYKGVLFHNL